MSYIINGMRDFPDGINKFANLIVYAILDCLNDS